MSKDVYGNNPSNPNQASGAIKKVKASQKNKNIVPPLIGDTLEEQLANLPLDVLRSINECLAPHHVVDLDKDPNLYPEYREVYNNKGGKITLQPGTIELLSPFDFDEKTHEYLGDEETYIYPNRTTGYDPMMTKEGVENFWRRKKKNPNELKGMNLRDFERCIDKLNETGQYSPLNVNAMDYLLSKRGQMLIPESWQEFSIFFLGSIMYGKHKHATPCMYYFRANKSWEQYYAYLDRRIDTHPRAAVISKKLLKNS